MKRLHSLALCAVFTPAIALGAGSVLAPESTSQDPSHELQSLQVDQDATHSTMGTTQSDQYPMKSRGYMDSAPLNGMQASDLIGATVRSTADEDVGPVEDLLLDENGQVVAIIVSVGGFLGIGQTNVAIGWDHVSRSGDSDDPELRIDVTGENLRDAPAFVTLD